MSTALLLSLALGAGGTPPADEDRVPTETRRSFALWQGGELLGRGEVLGDGRGTTYRQQTPGHEVVERREDAAWPGRPARQELEARLETGAFTVRGRLEEAGGATAGAVSRIPIARWIWSRDGEERSASVGNARFAFVTEQFLLPLFPIADAVPRLAGAGASFDVVSLPGGRRVRGDLRYEGIFERTTQRERRALHRFVAEFDGRRVQLSFDAVGQWMVIDEPARAFSAIRLGVEVVPAGIPFDASPRVMERRVLIEGVDGPIPSAWLEPRSRPLRAAVLALSGTGAQDCYGDGVPGPAGRWWKQWAAAVAPAGVGLLAMDDPGAGLREAASGERGLEDEVRDAAAAIAWLRERHGDGFPVFVLGHSDGGWVAARVAERTAVAGLIRVGVPRRALDRELLVQVERLARGRGDAESEVRRQLDEVRGAVGSLRAAAEAGRDADWVWAQPDVLPLLRLAPRPYWQSRLALDPGELLARFEGPVLELYGGADRQVLGPGAGSGARVLDGLDHFLVRNPSGVVERALEPDRRLDPRAGAVVRAWLEKTLARRDEAAGDDGA